MIPAHVLSFESYGTTHLEHSSLLPVPHSNWSAQQVSEAQERAKDCETRKKGAKRMTKNLPFTQSIQTISNELNVPESVGATLYENVYSEPPFS